MTLGTAQGLALPILYAGVDTGENVYAVSQRIPVHLRPGQRRSLNTTEHERLEELSISVGGRSGARLAYVGHAGHLTATEFDTPPTDPLVDLQSGGIDKVELTPTGIPDARLGHTTRTRPQGPTRTTGHCGTCSFRVVVRRRASSTRHRSAPVPRDALTTTTESTPPHRRRGGRSASTSAWRVR